MTGRPRTTVLLAGALGACAGALGACGASVPGPGKIDDANPTLCAGVVDVPDAALRDALLAVLPERDPDGDGTFDILAEDLARLDGLSAPRLGIVDLTGLECAQQLRSLGLVGNEIVDVSPLRSLADLREVELGENDVADASPLADLERLEKLSLRQNGLATATAVAGLLRLTYLDLAENAIDDLAPLEGLTELDTLVLTSNGISSLAPLAKLAKLQSLRVDDNAVAELAPLSGLTQLRTLDLDRNEIDSLAPLASLVHLQILEVSGNRLTSLDGVGEMVELTRLVAQSNDITSTAGLGAKPVLTDLDLSDNEVADIAEVADLPGLRRLLIAVNRVTDLGPVTGLPQLRDLDARYNMGLVDLTAVGTLDGLMWFGAGGYDQVQDLSPLAGRDKLRTLIYQQAGPSDYAVLAGLPALVTLNLEDSDLDAEDATQVGAAIGVQALTLTRTGLTDLAPLAPLVALESLVAQDCAFSSIATFASFPNLGSADLRGTPLTSLAGVETHEFLRLLDVRDSQIADLQPLVQNATFRRGDHVLAQGTGLDAADCADIAALVDRDAVVDSDVACP